MPSGFVLYNYIIIYEDYKYINNPYERSLKINNNARCFIRNAYKMKSVSIQIAWHEGVRNPPDIIVVNVTFVLLIILTINHKKSEGARDGSVLTACQLKMIQFCEIMRNES